jgi:hypothetical protein
VVAVWSLDDLYGVRFKEKRPSGCFSSRSWLSGPAEQQAPSAATPFPERLSVAYEECFGHQVPAPMASCSLGERDLVTLHEDGFVVNGTHRVRTIQLSGDRPADWWKRQRSSVDSYRETHEALQLDPDEVPVYKIFGAFINAAAFATGASQPAILDVGCGIFRERSPSFTNLAPRCLYVGLDPLPENAEREYPFVCGRLEDLAAREDFAGRFDVFTFGTSLDHLEDLGVAAQAVRRLAAPNARMVCWNGLQEPERIALGYGGAVFGRLASYESKAAAMLAFAGYGALRLPRLLSSMARQRAAVEREAPLDSHYRWFTEENSRRHLSLFGEPVDIVALPNTHHCIATVVVRTT